MIETIPDEWDQNFDYEGDVQIDYDEAIDILENLYPHFWGYKKVEIRL